MSLTLTFAELALDAAAAVAQSTTDPEYLDDAGRIIGSPDAGPKPEQNGDRGGYAQLLTALVLFSGVGFIAWRIRREMQQGAAHRTGT